MIDEEIGTRNKKGDWKPSYLFSYGPLFELPFRPFIILKWIFSHPGYILPWLFFYGLIGLIVYLFLSPNLDVTSNLHYSWCLPILLRNFILILLWFGFLHFRLYVKNHKIIYLNIMPITEKVQKRSFYLRIKYMTICFCL